MRGSEDQGGRDGKIKAVALPHCQAFVYTSFFGEIDRVIAGRFVSNLGPVRTTLRGAFACDSKLLSSRWRQLTGRGLRNFSQLPRLTDRRAFDCGAISECAHRGTAPAILPGSPMRAFDHPSKQITWPLSKPLGHAAVMAACSAAVLAKAVRAVAAASTRHSWCPWCLNGPMHAVPTRIDVRVRSACDRRPRFRDGSSSWNQRSRRSNR